MEATLKMFAFLLLCCLCNGGNAYEECKPSDLAITQTVVPGHVVGGYRVYAVAVENRCICSQGEVKLACRGFNSSVHVDPAGVLRPDGDGELCTLNGSRPIAMGLEYAVKFYYAWSSQFSFKPVSSTIACSPAAPEPSW
ncbi:uncharacterized protein LOC133886406 [Phragmites australis]|uniref:uncharacterized protein LOC133886406 n=1 Tax=Phragmites australis TaxID=29695 RepID=UPI002D77704C|nr:uncharacterized protein LOC133886406 [Phragmites australis]